MLHTADSHLRSAVPARPLVAERVSRGCRPALPQRSSLGSFGERRQPSCMQRHRKWMAAGSDVPGVQLAAGYGTLPSNWQLVPLTNAVTSAVDVPNSGIALGGGSANAVAIDGALNDSLEAAQLTIQDGALVLIDIGRDTEVQGRRLNPGDKVVLHEGERVVVGSAAFLVRWTGQGAAPDPTEVEALLATERAALEAPSGASSVPSQAAETGQWALSLGILYLANKYLAKSTAAAGITFPSPLIGMFGIIAALSVLTATAKPAAENIEAFFMPALDWIARWLPLFYVPPLVVLPLAVEGIPGASLAKMLLVVLVGMPATLTVTAFLATSIRKIVNTELEPTEQQKPAKPFSIYHHVFWTLTMVGTFLAAAFGPASRAQLLHRPCLVAATVEGLLLGSSFPEKAKVFFHPLITCTLFANLAAYAYAQAVGWPYKTALKEYITKGVGGMGAGDYLMSFLGVVILSFGFRIFGQRRLMKRHAPEIFGSTLVSSAFSLFATAAFARALGLSSAIARALAPRSVTVALALPIAAQLGAPSSIAAAGVALTGLLGSNSVQVLLNAMRFNDPITRGLATAGASHGLGTAALAGKEPEALPFCALAYALIGIISTVLVTIPPVRAALLAVAG